MSRVWKGAVLCLALALVFVVTVPAIQAQTAPTPTKSLYERLGGVQAIAAVVDDFVDRLVKDPVVMANPQVKKAAASGHFTLPGLKFLLTEQLCEAAGGPQKYTGRSMKEAHKGLMITDKEWDAGAADVVATLNKFKVPAPEQKELLALIASTKKDIVMPEAAPQAKS